MPLQLNQSRVSLSNPVFSPMLTNLQANILKGHGRKFAYHLFIQFKTETIDDAKKWIVHFASSKVTNAFTQLFDAVQKRNDPAHDGGTLYTLSFSNYAYRTLQINSSIRQDKVFDNGMHVRAENLKDKLENWEEGFRTTQMDMLIIVADDDNDIAENCANDIINQIRPFARCVVNQRGNVLKLKDLGVGIEHFGYADGISQPMYLADEIDSQTSGAGGRGRVWDDKTNLDMVLVEEKDGIADCFGSYFVYRKLEQNVKAFKIAEGDTPVDPAFPFKKILPDVKTSTGGKNDELAGAMIVGRFENSMPVTKSSTEKVNPADPDPNKDTVDNDFDYSDDTKGLKCPFHSHIRLVNPRKGNPAQDPDEIRSHRITRRAIPYDDNDPKRIPDELITDITDDILKDKLPTGKVGLLFMCYQSDIESHFEELQGQWANTGVIDPATVSIGEDSLITQGKNAVRTLPDQWGNGGKQNDFKFSGFITMRGGEYFYTPSIPYLKNILLM